MTHGIGHNNPPQTFDERIDELRAQGCPYVRRRYHYCYVCKRTFHCLGIMKHRAMHKKRGDIVLEHSGTQDCRFKYDYRKEKKDGDN